MRTSTHKHKKCARQTPIFLFTITSLLCWPLVTVAAENEPYASDPLDEVQQEGPPLEVGIPEAETHASREADTDVLAAIGTDPANVTGKRLQFNNGEHIGTITDLRRKLENLELYLIVDAEEFFNEPVMYAVAVQDVEKMTADTVSLPMQPGMHLRGFTYYEDEFTAADDNFAEPAVTEIENEIEEKVLE